MKPFTPLALIFLTLYVVTMSNAQDVEEAVREFKGRFEDPFAVNGGLAIQCQSYGTNRSVNRSAPFDGTILGSLNISTLGVQTPLSFIFTSGGTAFNVSLPSFGFAGLSPRYRDYTLHLGDRSLTLGKYSFSNHSFRGVGGEVDKQTWYTRFFYGRLQRAQASDFNGFQNVDPLFRRMGYGWLVGAHPNEDGKIEISLFKAWDDPGSLGTFVDTNLILSPAENIILSTFLEQSIFKKFKIRFNFSNSGYTADRTIPSSQDGQTAKSFLGLLEGNGSTRWKNAWETRLLYLTKFGSLEFSFERIDPGYRTMGALFFQDDQENITMGLTTQLFSSIISIVVNGGIQNNNLQNNRSEKYRRWIGTIQTNIRPSKKLTANIGFSNFSSVNRQVRILDPGSPNRLTELALTNANLNVSLQYQISKTDHMLANFTHQKNQTITRDENISDVTNHINNTMIMYRRTWSETKIDVGLQGFLNRLNMPNIKQHQRGISLQLSKPFLKERLKGSMVLSYFNNLQSDLLASPEKAGNLWQLRGKMQYDISKQQHISIDGSMLSNSGSNIDAFNETRLRLNYQINFTNLQK